MILLEVDGIGVAVAEFKRYAPRSIDMQGVARRGEAFQGVKLKAWDIQGFDRRRSVQAIKSAKDAAAQARVDFARPAPGPKVSEGLALECPDHIGNV